MQWNIEQHYRPFDMLQRVKHCDIKSQGDMRDLQSHAVITHLP